MKVTVRGAVPRVGSALKAATGGSGGVATVIKLGWVLVLAPPGPLTTSDTVFVPAVA